MKSLLWKFWAEVNLRTHGLIQTSGSGLLAVDTKGHTGRPAFVTATAQSLLMWPELVFFPFIEIRTDLIVLIAWYSLWALSFKVSCSEMSEDILWDRGGSRYVLTLCWWELSGRSSCLHRAFLSLFLSIHWLLANSFSELVFVHLCSPVQIPYVFVCRCIRVPHHVMYLAVAEKRGLSFTSLALWSYGCRTGRGGVRTSDIMGIQRASYPRTGIPPAASDNGTGRKECAGCRTGPGVNERQDRVRWKTNAGWGFEATEKEKQRQRW